MFLDHTQRRTTVGRTPLDKWSARRRDLYLTTHDTHNRQVATIAEGDLSYFSVLLSAVIATGKIKSVTECLQWFGRPGWGRGVIKTTEVCRTTNKLKVHPCCQAATIDPDTNSTDITQTDRSRVYIKIAWFRIAKYIYMNCNYVKCSGLPTLILRLLMPYIYGAPILDVSRSHTTTQHSR